MRRVSRRPELPMAPIQILQPITRSPVQIPEPLVPIPESHLCRFHSHLDRFQRTTCADSRVTCPRTCADSRVTCPRTQIADHHVPEPCRTHSQNLCRFQSHVSEPPVQIPLSQNRFQNLFRSRQFGADPHGCCFTRPAHAVRIWRGSPRTSAASHGTLYC
ncbi:hypothetical protein TNCV_1499521 [Trichonephila clavipes]|nr:hypothetical protein TNCV_1499521 [Trichonephila clavipes]